MTDLQVVEATNLEGDPGAGVLPSPRHVSLIGRNIQEILLLIRFNLDEISDEWDDLVAAGRAIVEAGDTDRFALGDIAWCKITTRYGEGAIDAWADAIGVARSTAYQYRDVSRTFELSMRMDILEKYASLTWSHFYQASRVVNWYRVPNDDEDAPAEYVCRENDLDVAVSFLMQADELNWSARSKLKRAVDKYLQKPTQPAKLGDYEGDITAAVAWLTSVMFGETDVLPKDYTGRIRVAVHDVATPPQDEIEPLEVLVASMQAAGMNTKGIEPIIRVEASAS